jgi:hypothetical protein
MSVSALARIIFSEKNCGFRKRNIPLPAYLKKEKMNSNNLFFLAEMSFPTLQTTVPDGRKAVFAERETASSISGGTSNTFGGNSKSDTSDVKAGEHVLQLYHYIIYLNKSQFEYEKYFIVTLFSDCRVCVRFGQCA